MPRPRYRGGPGGTDPIPASGLGVCAATDIVAVRRTSIGRQARAPHSQNRRRSRTTVAERFKQEAIAGHVILTKGERSPLAELATQIL